MTLQFTWQGCDSLLAAPLVLDLARLALLAQRRGESGRAARTWRASSRARWGSTSTTSSASGRRSRSMPAAGLAESEFIGSLIRIPVLSPPCAATPILCLWPAILVADEPSVQPRDRRRSVARGAPARPCRSAGRSRRSCRRADGWRPTRSGCLCRGTTSRSSRPTGSCSTATGSARTTTTRLSQQVPGSGGRWKRSTADGPFIASTTTAATTADLIVEQSLQCPGVRQQPAAVDHLLVPGLRREPYTVSDRGHRQRGAESDDGTAILRIQSSTPAGRRRRLTTGPAAGRTSSAASARSRRAASR